MVCTSKFLVIAVVMAALKGWAFTERTKLAIGMSVCYFDYVVSYRIVSVDVTFSSKCGWSWTAATLPPSRRATRRRRRQKIDVRARRRARHRVKAAISASAARSSLAVVPTTISRIHRTSLEAASAAALKTSYTTDRYIPVFRFT